MASALDTSANQSDLKAISKSASEYGVEFVNVFYKALDNKRQDLGKYYAEDAKIVWNGNEVNIQNRQAFHNDLPDSSHNVECYDVQPITSEFNLTEHYMILISVSGSVKYKGQPLKMFFENFILKAFESKWKIISDTYRFAE